MTRENPVFYEDSNRFIKYYFFRFLKYNIFTGEFV
jgi:hypothetical protein